MNELITKQEMFVPDKDGHMVVSESAIETINSIERQRKEFDKAYKKMKATLLSGMEEYGIKKAETEDLLITYVEPTERMSIDMAKLWDKYFDAAFDCQKESEVKASVKITIR